ncbi:MULTISPECIES: hypothetical protein [unclassified Thioalkalivibrio]|uniref:hypothetical protein n=1 Tax=unclassified Thioalkalivibrio TaxID=2621013 RepID=UPI001E3789CF|nr:MULTISPECIES: hypothetical protein [unclassified Thioalkalivibrio]
MTAGDPSDAATEGMRVQVQPAAVARPGTPAWDGYFPASLPLDWQLAYLGHFRSRVFVPGVLGADGALSAPFGDWDDAVPPNLRVTVSWPPETEATAGVAGLTGLARVLGERLEGVAFEPGVAVEAAVAGLRGAGLERLQVAGPGESVGLPGVDEAVWYPQLHAGEGPGFWRLRPAGEPDPADWRVLVEAVAGCSPAGALPVFLEASPGVLDGVRTIAKLLGKH